MQYRIASKSDVVKLLILIPFYVFLAYTAITDNVMLLGAKSINTVFFLLQGRRPNAGLA